VAPAPGHPEGLILTGRAARRSAPRSPRASVTTNEPDKVPARDPWPSSGTPQPTATRSRTSSPPGGVGQRRPSGRLTVLSVLAGVCRSGSASVLRRVA
jgi:hypothetical protein